MSTIGPLVEEYKRETTVTRKLLERLPDDKWNFKPHPKSYSLGELVSHIVDIQTWATVTVELDEFVMDPDTYKAFVGADRDSVLAGFDNGVTEATKALNVCTDEALTRDWTLKAPDGTVYVQNKKASILRDFVLSHMIHHRGQLTVYLRLNDVPLPQVYGPTADDPSM
ncbi:MAG: DinB family protein [Candidatus Hydrogenedentes bacterium]|nr:DinB family protein [Candidatus Hydrogenedentota bacterium]